METSGDIKDITAALIEAQKEITPAKKNETNKHFGSKYADLSDVMVACKSALGKHNLAIIQAPGMDENGNVFVETMISHPSGQFIKSRATAKPIRIDPQGVGSAITYLRRYGLAAMVGVVQDDDDGNAGSETAKPDAPTEPKSKPKVTRGVDGIKNQPEPIMNPAEADETADNLISQINEVKNEGLLKKWQSDKKNVVESLPQKLKEKVMGEYGQRLNEFRSEAA